MNTHRQTFPRVLQSGSGCGKINASNGWLMCPRCGRGKVLKLLPTTEARDLTVHCKICKQESVVNIPSVPVP